MSEIRELDEAAIIFAEEDLSLWARSGNPPDEEDDSSAPKKSANTVSKIIAKLKGLKGAEWSQINYSTIMACRNNKNIGKAVKIRGSFKRLDEVAPVSTGNSMADILRFEFQDERGDVLRTTRITDSRLQKVVQEFFGEYLCLDFYGTIIPEWQGLNAKNKWLYRFFLIHAHPSEDPLSMVQATRDEIAEAKEIVSAHTMNDGDLLSYIGTKLVEAVRIKGLDEAPQLEQALRFALFQSLSDGYSSNGKISYKLHSLVIGSPAVGKKLLSEAASLLNPVSKEAHPSKITRAGIIGAATNTSGQWKSDPGLIPLAHRGVFIVQDFHHVKNKGDLMGVFSMVMEDGLVIDATAARQAHHALTSIHIDTNRLSHLHVNDSSPQSPTDQLLDVGITMNVLSRFDFIIEIPRDTARQLEIALEMHSEPVICVSRPDSGSANKLARNLKVLIAYLRSEYAEIEIPIGVMGNIRQEHEKLLNENSDRLESLKLLGDFQTRLANSIHKLVFASARANARSVATAADVETAFGFVRTKLEFLAQLEFFQVPEYSDPNKDKVSARRDYISSKFAGTVVSVTDIMEDYNTTHKPKVSDRTIRRDLKTLAEKVGHDEYKIPEQKSDTMTNGHSDKVTTGRVMQTRHRGPAVDKATNGNLSK